MRRAVTIVAIAYVVAAAVALFVGHAVKAEHPIVVALWADLAATVAIFAFSVAYRNSSFYDAYWSLAPLAIVAYWALRPEVDVDAGRRALVLVLIAWWALRLTWNWLRGWTGLDHEDWRYVNLQRQTGRAYWLVSFGGIHMLPTLWVFGGLLPAYAVLAVGARPLGVLDALATAVTAGAIWLEQRADHELRRFRATHPPSGEFLRTGVWAWSRHPNYLGEMGFWWGLYLFGLAAAPSYAWTIVGALAITLMFRFVSLPMIETRMSERRPGYAEYAQRSAMVLPRRPPAAEV